MGLLDVGSSVGGGRRLGLGNPNAISFFNVDRLLGHSRCHDLRCLDLDQNVLRPTAFDCS